MDTRSSLYDQILVPELRICEFDATPPPPDSPAVIAVNNDSVTFQSINVESGIGILSLELEWSPVTGNISSYEVRLVELGPTAGEGGDRDVLEIFPPELLKVSSKLDCLVSEPGIKSLIVVL